MSFVVTFPLAMTLLYTTQYTTNVFLKILSIFEAKDSLLPLRKTPKNSKFYFCFLPSLYVAVMFCATARRTIYPWPRTIEHL